MPYRLEIHAISARKLDIRREIAGSLKNGRGKTPIRNPGETPIVLLPAQQFPVIIVGKRVILHGSAEEEEERRRWGRTDGGDCQNHGSDAGSSEETGT